MVEDHKKDVESNSSPDLAAVHDSMLEGLGQLAAYFGFSKVMGQLYGTLLMSSEPLSLDDMMERLQISKAGVSTNMRTLEVLGMVRQAWVRGGNGRRKYYEAETDFWQIITNILSSREMRDLERAVFVMEENKKRLDEALHHMDSADKETAEVYLERIAQMQGLFKFAQLMITTVLSQAGEVDFSDISTIEIQ